MARSNSLVRDYGVSDGNVFHLVLKLSDLQIINVRTAYGEEFTFHVERSRDVGYVKQQVAKNGKGLVDVEDQEIVWDDNVLDKIWSFTSFRIVFVTDDPITEASDPNSTPVGRGGSTLEIQGSSPHFQKYKEVFVVSETGRLRFARGYAIFETVFVDTPIGYSVINFWAPCRVVKNE
ncbi:hypothetical protein VitviT2T_017789 [Vitis vinifera]|uniref:Dirigent protein n=1 Tax=Vitis vinifera TaxID=29760 RepID=A0ABY9CX88_VITVI|nr:hypothetical protein VitviT2T_017789 [Vitis vinifera]